MSAETRRESGWPFFLMALLVFLLLAADVLSLFVGKLLDGRLVFLGILVLAGLKWLEAAHSGATIPSFLREYRGFEHRYAGHGAIVALSQYLYYLLESAMVLLMIALFQRAGEIWTRLAWLPWGGLGLTLTWGLAHYASHPEGASTVVLSALLFGLVFVGVRKSVLPSLATVYLAFVL